MNQIIEKNLATLNELCHRHSVKKLALFGSALNDNFNPDSSDLDFYVEFQSLPPDQHADTYFSLLFALEDLFSRRVDLVETQAIRNPYFLKELESHHQDLYAA